LELVEYKAGDGSHLKMFQGAAPLEVLHGPFCWKRVSQTQPSMVATSVKVSSIGKQMTISLTVWMLNALADGASLVLFMLDDQ